MKLQEQYANCWYCDNIISHPEKLMLLCLDPPRLKIVINKDYFFSPEFSFKDLLLPNLLPDDILQVEWLDEFPIGTEEEREEILQKLWDFSIKQVEADEKEAMEYLEEYLDEE